MRGVTNPDDPSLPVYRISTHTPHARRDVRALLTVST